jgi:alpha-1,2-mannosyltransferase
MLQLLLGLRRSAQLAIRREVRPVRREREDEGSIRRWRRLAWLLLAASCIAYLTVSIAHQQAFHPFGRRDYFDLRVYRGAAQLILTGHPLYGAAIWQWAPFTYPPFAAIAFAPLALLPVTIDELIVTILSVAALFAIVSLTLRLACGKEREAASARRWRSAAVPLGVALALWLEPLTATLGYGQLDLVIALLIVYDLARPDTAKSKGALIGLAAGLKLTPLIFVPYLFFSRRPRAALVALGAFAMTAAAGYALLPGDAQRFWGGLFLDPRRVGGCCIPANQSLRGVILQLAPSFGTGQLLGIALTVGVIGVGLAVLASRRGDEATGFSLCATTGLLVSPVSWTHQWTLVVPALLLLAVRIVRGRSSAGIIALAALIIIGCSYLPTLMAQSGVSPGGALQPVWSLASAPYVLVALGALAFTCVREIRAARSTIPHLARIG